MIKNFLPKQYAKDKKFIIKHNYLSEQFKDYNLRPYDRPGNAGEELALHIRRDNEARRNLPGPQSGRQV